MAEEKIIVVKEERKEEASNGNGSPKLTLEDIKKLPPEKRIPALKKLEEDRRKELELADKEEKKAFGELQEEKKREEEEEISLNIKRELDIAVAKLNEEKEREDEKKKAANAQEEQKKKTLEQELENTTVTGTPQQTGTVTYSNNTQQLSAFYAVTTKVKQVLPGVLERMTTGNASIEDQRFIDSYRQSMEAVKAETAYVSQETKKEFYELREQITGMEQYHQQTLQEKQKREEKRTTDDYRIDRK